jgi:hypothetical protein
MFSATEQIKKVNPISGFASAFRRRLAKLKRYRTQARGEGRVDLFVFVDH